jgi:hypothetical protein
MSERYTRLFSLPTNLYLEGSPILVSAGALLKDNQKHKILVQLKFFNISKKVIKSVKVKVNAYDTTKSQLVGVDEFSYLDLSAPASQEFGQETPIYLPNANTRSFSLEILAVVFTDNEIFTPDTTSLSFSAPDEVLKELQRIDAEKKAAKAKRDQIIAKQRKWTIVFSTVSIVSVVLSAYLKATYYYAIPFPKFITINYLRYLLALIIPCLCLITAFLPSKDFSHIKPIFVTCITLFALQILSMIFSANIAESTSKELLNLHGKINFYVNGADFLEFLDNLFGRTSLKSYISYISYSGHSPLAVLPNVLCTTILAINCKKMK